MVGQDDTPTVVELGYAVMPLLALHINEESFTDDKTPDLDVGMETHASRGNARSVSRTRFTCRNEKDNLFRAVISCPDRNNLSPLGISPYHCVITSYEVISIEFDDHYLDMGPISGSGVTARFYAKKLRCAPLEKETVISAIKILTLKSTDNENEPWNKIGTVGELLDYYLKL
jgi:hypothetical protein